MDVGTATLAEKLHLESPYGGFPLEDWDPDLQGWGSDHPIFERVIEALRPEIIIEVGTWKGRSAIHMAHAARRLGLRTQIVCVDTWLGAPEHVLKRDSADHGGSLKPRFGYPQLYYQFLANVLHEGCEEMIVPLPQTSDNASVILRRLGVRADAVYIDAAHEYGPVLSDLRNYWELVADRGVMFGDDYVTAEGVTRAVHDFARELNVPFVGTRGKFVIGKGRAVDLGGALVAS